MSFLAKLGRIVTDPPPDYVFELSEAGIAWAGVSPRTSVQFVPMEPGIVEVSPLKDNVHRPDLLAELVRQITPANGKKKNRRRGAAVVLPDYSSRVTVLDFDTFPSKPDEQMSLVRFRVKKSVPFDLESAVVRYFAQPRRDSGKVDVVVAVTALEIVSRYEAPFRSAGLHPGLVSISALAALELTRAFQSSPAITMLAKLTGRSMSVSVMEGGVLRLFRCVELPEVTREEILGVLHPTFAYAEDVLGKGPDQLLVCGFGQLSVEEQEGWQRELEIRVTPLRSSHGDPGPFDAGLRGYLESVTP